MKRYVVILGGSALLAGILAGCGNSTPQPTPQATIAAMKAEDAKHAAAMANAQRQHDAEAAAMHAAQSNGQVRR